MDLRTAQELAGHSTPELTARYSHRRLHDLTGAVGRLPALVPTGVGDDSDVPGDVPPGRTPPHRSARAYTGDGEKAAGEGVRDTLENQRPGADPHLAARDRTVSRVGVEPTTSGLKVRRMPAAFPWIYRDSTHQPGLFAHSLHGPVHSPWPNSSPTWPACPPKSGWR